MPIFLSYFGVRQAAKNETNRLISLPRYQYDNLNFCKWISKQVDGPALIPGSDYIQF